MGCGVWGVGFYPFSGGQLPNFQGKITWIFPPITPMVGTFWGQKSLKALSKKVFRFIQQALNSIKYLSKINYTYLTTSCLLPIFTRKLILHDYLTVLSFHWSLFTDNWLLITDFGHWFRYDLNRISSIKYLLILAWDSCRTCQQQKFVAAGCCWIQSLV